MNVCNLWFSLSMLLCGSICPSKRAMQMDGMKVWILDYQHLIVLLLFVFSSNRQYSCGLNSRDSSDLLLSNDRKHLQVLDNHKAIADCNKLKQPVVCKLKQVYIKYNSLANETIHKNKITQNILCYLLKAAYLKGLSFGKNIRLINSC